MATLPRGPGPRGFFSWREGDMRRGLAIAGLSLLAWATVSGQSSLDRERARPHVRAAWGFMRTEAWAEAEKSFQQAISIDAQFEDAYYGMGLARMRMKRFGDAIDAYEKCRDLYRSYAGRQFSNRQEAQRYRQDRLTEIDELIRQYQTGPQSMSSQDRLRQLQEQRRQVQDYIARGNNMTIENSVPAFVSLALGSAYFRTERFLDAEREYKAAIAADPKSGEAHSNLAVVYLQTGRYQEADDEVKAAERAGYKIHPELKREIKAKLG
jgi:tetratricopeptide (TPR) repeat protein